MESVQYYLALLMLIFATPMFTVWFVIHPFVHFWRRLGVGRSYMILAVYLTLFVMVLYWARDDLLAVYFGFYWPGFIVGCVLLVICLVLRALLERELGRFRLTGLHELRGDNSEDDLITSGIYARIRHPRYLEGMILMAAFALLTNYLVMYVLWLVSVPALWWIIRLEERELLERFGTRYEDYMRRVPRIIPRHQHQSLSS